MTVPLIQIEFAGVPHARALSDYYERNVDRFAPWHPQVSPSHHSVQSWLRRLEYRAQEVNEGQAAHFVGLDGDRVIATCSITAITYDPASSGLLGYSVDRDFEGTGTMSTLVKHAVRYAFDNLRLQRLRASYMPANVRSARLLARLGFVQDGIARRHLCINGRWEDHVLASCLNASAIAREPA